MYLLRCSGLVCKDIYALSYRGRTLFPWQHVESKNRAIEHSGLEIDFVHGPCDKIVSGKIPCRHHPGRFIHPLEQLPAKEVPKVIEVFRSYERKGIHSYPGGEIMAFLRHAYQVRFFRPFDTPVMHRGLRISKKSSPGIRCRLLVTASSLTGQWGRVTLGLAN